MARVINSIRKVNAKLVNATINKYGASYPAQSPWRADGFNKVFVETESANPTQKDFLEGNSSVYVYAIGSNIGSLLPYSLASFTNIKELYLFSPTMVNIGDIDNDYLTYLTNSDLKVYVPSNLLQSYINTYGDTGKHLENRFDEITDDYPLTVSGSGDLTSQELTNQLMNNYESVDRTNCTKLIIQGFTNVSSVLWGYDFSEILPNLNNNIYVNGVKFDFSTFIIQDTTQDHILTASVVSASVNAISPSVITAIEKVVVPVDFTSYASGSITELQTFMNTNSIDKLVTTYEAGEMELSLSGDIVAKIVSINKTLEEALIYARSIPANKSSFQNDTNLIIMPPYNVNLSTLFNYFNGCSNLVIIYDFTNVYFGNSSLFDMFNNCSNLIKSKLNVPNVTMFGAYLGLYSFNNLKEFIINYSTNYTGTMSIQNSYADNIEKVLLNNFKNGDIWLSRYSGQGNKMTEQAYIDLFNSLGTCDELKTFYLNGVDLAKLSNSTIQLLYNKNWKFSIKPSAFTFTIGSNTYSCDFGMTWEQWCASAYNTDGYVVINNKVYNANGTSVIQLDSTNINSSSMIRYGDLYTLRNLVYVEINAQSGETELTDTIVTRELNASGISDLTTIEELIVSNDFVSVNLSANIPLSSLTSLYLIRLYGKFVETNKFSVSFSVDTWETIKAYSKQASTFYNLGDTKSITYDNNTYTIRLCDIGNRYDLSNGSGKNNIVCEFVELLPSTYKMNNTNTNSGGWASSNLKTETMPVVYNNLPSDLKNVISQVVISSSIGGTTNYDELSYSDNYLFVPNNYEIFGNKSWSSASEETTQYQLYSSNNNSSFRIKYKLGDMNGTTWWLRSPRRQQFDNFMQVYDSGSSAYNRPDHLYGVAPFFCI